jgi:hypothetical protein
VKIKHDIRSIEIAEWKGEGVGGGKGWRMV